MGSEINYDAFSIEQIVLQTGAGATGVAPDDGKVLWSYPWPGSDRIVQPARIEPNDLLIVAGDGFGLRRVGFEPGRGGWSAQDRWMSTRLKPNFNDFVVHEGYAYGFDGSILACIDVEDGSRQWKGGRYGHGQLVLLADQGLLLVVTERGGLALVAAAPDRFAEHARSSAIEGKTWNHPALAGNVLLMHNAEEIAALRLPPEDG